MLVSKVKRGDSLLRKCFLSSKVVNSADEAIRDVKNGSVILSGGFGLCGIPETLIDAVRRKGSTELTFVGNDAGLHDYGVGVLFPNNQVCHEVVTFNITISLVVSFIQLLILPLQLKKLVASHIGDNRAFEKHFLAGKCELEVLRIILIIVADNRHHKSTS